MSNSVAQEARQTVRPPAWKADSTSLYAANGARKYLNHAERQRALAAMAGLPADQALFALTLTWTGARISEVLELTVAEAPDAAGTQKRVQNVPLGIWWRLVLRDLLPDIRGDALHSHQTTLPDRNQK